MASTGRSRGRKRVRMDYDARRQLILQAARDLFTQRPYSKVSIADIAESAGVAKGLLHHYFDSKHDLYLEVVRDVARVPVPMADDTGAGGEASTADGVAEVWASSVDGFLGLIAEQPDLWLRSLRVGGSGGDDDVATILEESREVLADQTISALGLDDDGDVPELRALVRGYGGLVQEVMLEWLQRDRLDQDQVRTVVLHVMPLLVEQVLPLIREAEAGVDGGGDTGVRRQMPGLSDGARRTGGRGAPPARASSAR